MENKDLNKQLKRLSESIFQTGEDKELIISNKVLIWALIALLEKKCVINLNDLALETEKAVRLYEELERRFKEQQN